MDRSLNFRIVHIRRPVASDSREAGVDRPAFRDCNESTAVVVTPLDGSNHTIINHDQFGVFGNAADSLVAPEGTGALYVSIEQGVAVFCLSSAQCMPVSCKVRAGVLDRPASYVNGAGCVAIAASPVGFHERLFCTPNRQESLFSMSVLPTVSILYSWAI